MLSGRKGFSLSEKLALDNIAIAVPSLLSINQFVLLEMTLFSTEEKVELFYLLKIDPPLLYFTLLTVPSVDKAENSCLDDFRGQD